MAFCRWIEQAPWVLEVTGSARQISIIWLFHFLGYFLVVGTTVFVDLRVLGLAGRRQSATQLAKFVFPLTWVGLALVTITGLIMFTGYAVELFVAWVFWIKIAIFLLAAIFGLIVQANVPRWDRMPNTPSTARVIAVLSLILSIGTILASVEVPAFTGV
jgi:hypothetical protein